jgi:histidine triad (HIT) family protein
MQGMSGCLFCRIASGAVDAAVVFEDESSIAFLDHRPLFPGHTLLLPKKHVETLPELAADAVGPLFARAQELCVAVETAMQAQGTFVAINNRVSQSVPHLHIHVVPRRTKDGLRGFFWPRTKYKDAEEAEAVRVAVTNCLIRLRTSALG